MKEVWKKIDEFDGDYEVSNLGRVKSVGRFIPRVGPHGEQYYHKERILIPSMDGCGYYHVRLAKNNSMTLFKVHRLVAKHFLESYSEDLTVNHINHNKRDNSVQNLEMMSLKENIDDQKLYANIYKCIETGEEFTRPKRYFDKRSLPYSKYKFLKSILSGEKYNNFTFTLTMTKR